MKNREVDEKNWEKYQKELDELHNKIPKELKGTVNRIVNLELELTNLEG